MKICYVNPTILVRRPIAELIDRLGSEKSNKKEKIGIFIPKKPFRKIDKNWHANKSLSKAKIYSYNAVNLPLRFEWPIPISPRFWTQLYRIFKTYDVVHMWTYFYINSWAVILFKKFFPKVKLIMTCDTFPAYSFSAGKITDFMFKTYTKLFGKMIFKIPDLIQVYGESLVKYTKQAKLGILKKKIKILSTGINLTKFKQIKKADRKKLGLNQSDFVMVYAGLIVPRKGIKTMLRVLKNINKNNKTVKLLLIGDGPARAEYKEMAQEMGLSKQVKFTGWRKDIPSLFAMSDVLFLPSKGEGLPGIIMEGMASGLPIVASKIPCIPDLVLDGENGFLFHPDDVKGFTEAIIKLIEDDRLRDEMGDKSLVRIEKFNWDRLIGKYDKLYSQ